MWVFQGRSVPEHSLCRQSMVLTACDHTAEMDPIVSNLWAYVEFRRLLREPGKDNTDLAFLVPTWLTRYRRGFNPVFAHVITDGRVVALHPALQSFNWSRRWTDESCPQCTRCEMLEIHASAPSDEPLPCERLVTRAMPWPALPDLTSSKVARRTSQ